MSQLNRRSFVQSTLAIGAGLYAAPSIVQGQLANEKIGVCIVGTGGRGGSHISEFLNDSRCEIVAIAEVDEGQANKRAEQIGGKQGKRPVVVNDMREAFDRQDVQIVSTATPNHWHALTGVWAMQAGKDAYVEKPISHNVGEGAALVAAMKKYNRMCQVGTQCRSSVAIIEAVKFMNEGGIGDVNFARGLCWKRRKSIGALGDYKIPENVDFNMWSGPATYTDPKLTRSRFHYDWHWQRHYGNGDSGNQGPHQTDIARWGLGIDTHPSNIITFGGRLGYKAERKDPDYVDAGDTANTQVSIYDYGDKCITFETRGLSVDDAKDEEINKLFPGKGNRIGVIFYGTDGYVVQRSYSHCEVFDKDFNKVKEFKGGGNHFGNFVSACVSRDASTLNASAWEGHLSAAIAHLGNASYYLGEDNKVSVEEAESVLQSFKSLDDNVDALHRTAQHLRDNGVDLEKTPISLGPHLAFDPKKEVFTNNDEANALLTREYRDGFVCPQAADV